MSESQADRSINFSNFADWCKHKDSLSQSARHTVEVLLEQAGTSDCNEADKVLSNLTKLILESNQITDLAVLSGLTNLTTLSLESNQITDLAVLSGLTNLTYLNLQFNRITDITGLSALTHLTKLSLSYNQITDITGLSALTNLRELYLCVNQITDITALSGLTHLTKLSLLCNQITDITALSGLTHLTKMSLSYNQITDITGLSALTNLTNLYLENNQITDITALSALTNLTRLSLYDNPITDLNLSLELTQKYLTLSTTPIDSRTATETAKKLYAAIGLEAPQVIVCSSPQVFSLKLLEQFKIYSSSQHHKPSAIEAHLAWKNFLFPELFQSVDVGLSPALWRTLLYEIILELDAESVLLSEFENSVENYLFSLGYECVHASYQQPLNPKDLVKEIHLTEFLISKFGVTLDEKAQELLRCKQQLFEECGWILPFEKVCLICDRPLHIRFDTENRLHAEGESAIAFADGWCLYFHHGVKLPEQYGKVHPDLWQAEWLLSEENAEIRRVLIQRIGYDRICQQLQAVELDSWQEYTLLKIDNADVEPIYLLKMTCPSTGHIHALRVPPQITSAREAIRWVNWDIEPEEFSVET